MAGKQVLPFFMRAGRVVQLPSPTNANDRDFHFDLLSFISIVDKFKVDLVQLTWQPALVELGRGGTSTVQQAQIDSKFNLAFKRSTEWTDERFADTKQQENARYKAITYELIALELLSSHPNVIDLLGITWETEAQTEQIWPVLLTQRSEQGNMAEFLSSKMGKDLDTKVKLGLCADIARACQAMHALGIVHGDIKLENVLIFPDGEGWIGKLIDFGYSCLGTSEDELVNVARTRPWQAPEHKENFFFALRDARRMDVYSFGMAVCRIFLSDQPGTIFEQFGYSPDAGEQLSQHLDYIDGCKASCHFLELVQETLLSSKSIEQQLKAQLGQIFETTLQHEPLQRAASFGSIISILGSTDDVLPPLAANASMLDVFSHTILNLGGILADLDDTDYILHQTLVADLKRRTSTHRPCACFQSAARQLWLCYEIGFGVPRDPHAASKWLSKGWDDSFNSSDFLSEMDSNYEGKEPRRINEKMGWDTNFPFDPVELYRVQKRLNEAEQAFREEVRGRKESLGRKSNSYISQLSTLALILSASRKFDEAENISREAALSSEETYGKESELTISAQNYLANILYRRGKWDRLIELQLELLPVKLKVVGDQDASTWSSQNSLVAAYCNKGQYLECINLAREIIRFRTQHLGEEHTETLTTRNWLCRALIESGDLTDLENQARSLVDASKRACGEKHESTVERKEILAATILVESKLNDATINFEKLKEAMSLIYEVLAECDEIEAQQILVVRAHITLICILSLQGRFEDTINKIARMETMVTDLADIYGPEYPDIQRFKRVRENILSLRQLEGQGKASMSQANIVRDRLFHRCRA